MRFLGKAQWEAARAAARNVCAYHLAYLTSGTRCDLELRSQATRPSSHHQPLSSTAHVATQMPPACLKRLGTRHATAMATVSAYLNPPQKQLNFHAAGSAASPSSRVQLDEARPGDGRSFELRESPPLPAALSGGGGGGGLHGGPHVVRCLVVTGQAQCVHELGGGLDRLRVGGPLLLLQRHRDVPSQRKHAAHETVGVWLDPPVKLELCAYHRGVAVDLGRP
mmetsp:Transcript_29723/g.60945  ORF Transcript_29723/g.60945 Transcript_29723/m.60945 type:complete len:223 (-) Transcript_29723:394-1062(-)